jgi:uncharacterized protein (DUF1501 family)
MISRRRLLGTGAALTLAWQAGPLAAAPDAAGRFVLLILRGGMDGLAAVPPHGDRDYRKARGGLADALPGEPAEPLDLDGFFSLHPRLPAVHGMYRDGELAVVHAVAPPYRDRSHFDAQDVLETGMTDPSGSTDGWLYRALAIAPGSPAFEQYAMALGGGVPRVLQGATPVGGWAPDRLPAPDDDTMVRVRRLYEEDPVLGPRLEVAMQTDAMARAAPMGGGGADALAVNARAAAGFLKAADGPRIAVLESGGWDTHANQAGQLANRLGALDAVIGELRSSMGSVWSSTVVAMVTEFGRTVAMNGTRGTDHGVGGVALIAGGAVNGGRVLGDWPGLGTGSLYEGRDLKPTTDMRAIFATVLTGHMGFDGNAVDEHVFPDARLPPIRELLRA